MLQIRQKLFSVFIIAVSFISVVNYCSAYSFLTDSGITSTAKGVYGDPSVGSSGKISFEGQIAKYIQLVLSFVGVVFLGLVIYGGYLWMTAQGDSKQVDKAKELITQVVLGLLIVTSAYAITSFMASELIVVQ